MEKEKKEFKFSDKAKPRKGFKKDMRFWATIAAVIFIVLILQFFLRHTPLKAPAEKQIKNSIKVKLVKTQWVRKYQKSGKVRIVPTITVKIKNTGNEPLKYLALNVVFELEDFNQELGSGYKLALQRKSLKPGSISKEIKIECNHGYTASSVKAFFENYSNWRTAWAKLFIKWKSSNYVAFGEYKIKRQIKGVIVKGNESMTVDYDSVIVD